MKITPAARVGVFVWIALFGGILVLNAVQAGWFRSRRHNWAFLSYEEARVAGRDDARRELASGSLAMEGGAGLPAEWTGEFIKILFADYQIKFSGGGGCEPDPPSRVGYITGFDEIMLPAIEKRFGKGVFESAARRAEKQYEVQQIK